MHADLNKVDFTHRPANTDLPLNEKKGSISQLKISGDASAPLLNTAYKVSSTSIASPSASPGGYILRTGSLHAKSGDGSLKLELSIGVTNVTSSVQLQASPGGTLNGTNSLHRNSDVSIELTQKQKKEDSASSTPNDTPPSTPRVNPRPDSLQTVRSSGSKGKLTGASHAMDRKSIGLDPNPNSPGSKKHRQSSIYMASGLSMNRGTGGDTPSTGSEKSVTITRIYTAAEKQPEKNEFFDNYNIVQKWDKDSFGDSLVSFKQERSFDGLSSKPFLVRQSCKDIAATFQVKLGEKSVPHTMHKSLKAAPDSAKAYDIVKAFVDYIYKSLEHPDAKLADYWRNYFNRKLESTVKGYWNDTDEDSKRAKFIETEVVLLTQKEVKEKAAGIVYHILFYPVFATQANLPWLKAIALSMGKQERKTLGIKALVELFKNEHFLELLEIFKEIVPYQLTEKTTSENNQEIGPYQALTKITTFIKRILTENGYGNSDLSNREVAANILKMILNDRDSLAAIRAKLSDITEEKPIHKLSSARETTLKSSAPKESTVKEATGVKIESVFKPETIENHLTFIDWLNMAQCSSDTVSYPQWHDKTKKIFRSAKPDEIKFLLNYLIHRCKIKEGILVKRKEELSQTSPPNQEGITKAQNLISTVKKITEKLDFLKDNQKSLRLPVEEDIEYIESALFFINMASLQMAQNILEQRVKKYKEIENVQLRRRKSGTLASDLQTALDNALEPKDGPWMYFLTRYHQLSTSPEEAQEFIGYDKFNDLTKFESRVYHGHRREASNSRNLAQEGNFTPGQLHTIGEELQKEEQAAAISKAILDSLRNEYDRRRLFFQPWFREFYYMFIWETPLAKILMGTGSLGLRKGFNTTVEQNSRLSADLKNIINKRFREIFEHEQIRLKLFPKQGDEADFKGILLSNIKTKLLALGKDAKEIEKFTTLEELKRFNEEIYLRGYNECIGNKYMDMSLNRLRAQRLFHRLSIDKNSLQLKTELNTLLEKENSPEALEEKREGTGSLKMPPKLTERDLLRKELEFVSRVFEPGEYGAIIENQTQVTKLFEDLFCSTLGIDPTLVRAKKKKDSASVIQV